MFDPISKSITIIVILSIVRILYKRMTSWKQWIPSFIISVGAGLVMSLWCASQEYSQQLTSFLVAIAAFAGRDMFDGLSGMIKEFPEIIKKSKYFKR